MTEFSQHFFLVEFGTKSSVNAALESATHVKYDEVVPVQSPMLWFRNNRATSVSGKDKEDLSGVMISLNGSGIPKNEEVVERLVAARTVKKFYYGNLNKILISLWLDKDVAFL